MQKSSSNPEYSLLNSPEIMVSYNHKPRCPIPVGSVRGGTGNIQEGKMNT